MFYFLIAGFFTGAIVGFVIGLIRGFKKGYIDAVVDFKIKRTALESKLVEFESKPSFWDRVREAMENAKQ